MSVPAPINRQGFAEVLKEMPAAARSLFHADPEELKAEIDSRIQFWDQNADQSAGAQFPGPRSWQEPQLRVAFRTRWQSTQPAIFVTLVTFEMTSICATSPWQVSHVSPVFKCGR